MKRALLVALALLAPAAYAAPAPAAGARGALTEGFARFEARDFDGAARRFEEAAARAAGERLDPGAALYDQGCALLKAGKAIEAAAAFAEALRSPDPGLGAKAHFNRGVALVTAAEAAVSTPVPAAALGYLDQALAAFESAMRAAPDDEDPKVNHELASRRKAQLEQQLRDREQRQGAGGKPPPPARERTQERDPGTRPQRPEASGSEMKPEEARAMLDALRQQEMSQRRRIGPPRGESARVEKAW